ncbi:MAG: NADH:ubiquinone reductase (Na(+)-transporting) subunit C [Prevotella sp.]
MAEKKQKGLNTNSNSYTIIYSIVIVVLVAFLLAFVFQVLKPTQDANVALDKKKQILYSLNIRGLNDIDAAAKYNEVVVADEILDTNGNVTDKGTKGGEKAGFKLNSTDLKNGKLALFVCYIDGENKYVIPVYGMGLWGAINGYIAINADKQTVYGAYFNHDSETAGLGAEIKDNKSWQEKFQHKKLFGQDTTQIALSVNKKIDDPATQVDAVTGATLTSNGVTEMLHKCLGEYIAFLSKK